MCNPKYPVQVSPKDYELQVVGWLNAANSSPVALKVEHLKMLDGVGGEYEIDAVATLSVFGGAEIKVIVECKRYIRPVEREVLLTLWAKLDAVHAHKALIFSTSGFQSGALKYAVEKGICCVNFLDSSALMMTKSMDAPERDFLLPPKSFSGVILEAGEGVTHASTIDSRHIGPLTEWLRA